jgi:hypothetical protein
VLAANAGACAVAGAYELRPVARDETNQRKVNFIATQTSGHCHKHAVARRAFLFDRNRVGESLSVCKWLESNVTLSPVESRSDETSSARLKTTFLNAFKTFCPRAAPCRDGFYELVLSRAHCPLVANCRQGIFEVDRVEKSAREILFQRFLLSRPSGKLSALVIWILSACCPSTSRGSLARNVGAYCCGGLKQLRLVARDKIK